MRDPARDRFRGAGALAVGAGLALSAGATLAEPPRTPTERQSLNQLDDQQQARRAHFHSYRNTLNGKNVANAQGDALATISDLVINRGSGEVRWLVVRFGDILGLGGTESLLPLRDIRWSFTDHTISTNLSEADLEALAEINRADWSNFTWNPTEKGDHYRDAFEREAAIRELTGRIVSVDRATPVAPEDEYLIVTIQPVRGDAERVVFGPSWFVMGHEAAPARGQRITVNAAPDPREPQLWIAMDAEIEGRSIRLRDQAGAPSWDATSRTADYAGAPHPYVLASTMMDAPVEALGDAAGEVHDLIIDAASRRVIFIAIDPNENFLGMLDTIRLAPWTVTNFTPADVLRIDATAPMITSSPEVPDKIENLNDERTRERIFEHFDVRPTATAPRVERTPSDDELKRSETPRGWTSHDPYAESLKSGERMELRGTVVATERVRAFPTVEGAVTILLLRDPAGATRHIHLGPDSYFQRHGLDLAPGDTVMIEARAGEVSGQSFIAAQRIQRNGDWVVLWNEEGRPVWDQRD